MMNVKDISFRQWQWIIVILSALLFLPFLGHVHLFDWDEINFAESAREMLTTGNWLEVQVDFEPFWEKPPLFIWMQALSMKLFGVNEFAARFPNALCGILSLLIFFRIGTRLYDKQFGLIWVLAYAGSFLPFFYFKSGIIDPWFNLFMFLGIYHMFRYFKNEGYWQGFLGAMFTGLAVLTKGPVGALIVGLCLLIFLFFVRFRVKARFIDLLSFFLVFSFFGGFWFLLILLNGNNELILDFIQYQVRLFQTEDAGHGGFLLYHFVLVFLGVFPASVFALKGFRRVRGRDEKADFRRLMQILFWLVMILFTIVKTKIVHYSSLTYFPLSFLAAYVIKNLITKNYRFPGWMKISFAVLSLIYALLLIVLSSFDLFKDKLIESGKVSDPFALSAMQADAGWTGFEFLPAIILIAGLILFFVFLKKGLIFRSVSTLFISGILFAFFSMALVVPRVEQYSQHAAIAFYKEHQGEDVYMRPVGFKSYAHLFYFRKPCPEHANTSDEGYLMEGDVDKDAFFVIKVQHLNKYMERYPEVKETGRKNGFVFCERKKKD